MAKAKRVCGNTSCSQLTSGSHCDEHKRTPFQGHDRGDTLPKHWPHIRRRILKRDHHQCVLCGSGHQLEVDHIRDRADHTANNLRTLCRSCHANRTAKQGAAAATALKDVTKHIT